MNERAATGAAAQGGDAAGKNPGAGNRYAPFLWMLSTATAALTLLLIVIGSLVTSHTAQDSNGLIQTVGDSIPTWPFGEVWNIELIHRVVAAGVGLCCIVLVITLAATEPRKWVRRLGYLALICVVIQGLLGGARVVWAAPEFHHYNSPVRISIAMVHATFAQLIFGLTCLISLATTKSWLESPPALESPDTARTRRLAIMTGAMVTVQILLGAWVRHLRFVVELRNIAVWIHILMAMGVAVHVILLSVRASNKHNGVFPIRQTAGLAVFFTGLQIVFGLLAYVMTPVGPEAVGGLEPEAAGDMIRSGHVASGAMILAMVVVVAARSFHLLNTPAEAQAAREAAALDAPAGAPPRDPADFEAGSAKWDEANPAAGGNNQGAHA